MNKQENTFHLTKFGFDDRDSFESKIVLITCYETNVFLILQRWCKCSKIKSLKVNGRRDVKRIK